MKDCSHIGTQPTGINSCQGNPPTAHQDPEWLARFKPSRKPYDPTKPWGEYALDQAEWRISVGRGTNADRAAIAHQRPDRAR